MEFWKESTTCIAFSREELSITTEKYSVSGCLGSGADADAATGESPSCSDPRLMPRRDVFVDLFITSAMNY